MNRRSTLIAFTEQGGALLSSVLRSGRAAQVGIAVMRAFVQSRQVLVMRLHCLSASSLFSPNDRKRQAKALISSPFLCWPDNPEAYASSPWLHFVRTVPVLWDETRVLPGSVIGESVILARRKGDAWYVAALNCRPEPHTIELDLASLDVAGQEMTLYREGDAKTGVRITAGERAPADNRLSATMPAGGGFLAHFGPAREYPGWR